MKAAKMEHNQLRSSVACLLQSGVQLRSLLHNSGTAAKPRRLNMNLTPFPDVMCRVRCIRLSILPCSWAHTEPYRAKEEPGKARVR
jgi:hypothetical protein